MIRVLACAIHCCGGLFFIYHLNEAINELQDGTMSAGKKIGPINVKARINDALIETVVFAPPCPKIGITSGAFKVPRLDGNNPTQCVCEAIKMLDDSRACVIVQ